MVFGERREYTVWKMPDHASGMDMLCRADHDGGGKSRPRLYQSPHELLYCDTALVVACHEGLALVEIGGDELQHPLLLRRVRRAAGQQAISDIDIEREVAVEVLVPHSIDHFLGIVDMKIRFRIPVTSYADQEPVIVR